MKSHPSRKRWINPGLVVTGLFFLLGTDAFSAEEEKHRRSFFDPNDGWLDLSEFIEHPMGFIPMVVPITEPAIGYGGAFAPVFIRPGKSKQTGKAERPQITAVGGMRTQNGSDGLVAFNKSYWFEDRLETVVAGVSASVNLDFHGIGENLSFGGDPMRYNLDAQGGMVQGRARLGDTDWWIGARYIYAQIAASFVRPDGFPEIIPERSFESTVGGLSLLIQHDTYDNLFTPTKGHLWQLDLGFYDQAFGASGTWQTLDAVAIHYWPLGEKFTAGLRTDLHAAFGDPPFYMLPSVQLRGVPVMSIQGDAVASVEAEVRWQLHHRFSLLLFGGAGASWLDAERLDNIKTTVSGGVGFRYLISKRFGLHMGMDVAIAENEDPALYIQFGNAWQRL